MQLALSIIVGLCLFSFYIAFLVLLGGSIILAPMNEVESIIFYTLVLRVLAVLFIPPLRKSHAQVKIALFSIETFVLVVLIFSYVLTQQPVYNILIGQVLTAWLGASSIVLTPYLIYQIAASMNKGMSTSALVLSVAPEYAVGAFLVGLGIISASTPPAGISAFGAMLVGSLRAQTTIEGEGFIGSNPLIAGVSLTMFLCLLFYIGLKQHYQSAALGTIPSEPLTTQSVKYHYQLVILMIGAVITLTWLFTTRPFLGGDDLFVLSLPAVIISSVLWGISRRGK